MRRRAIALLALLVVPFSARADESTGTVSGTIEGRTTTFHERRTEVIAPTIGARLEFPSGVRVHGQYLVDVITSSSVAVDIVASASVGVDPLARSTFQERRNEGSLSVGGALDRTGDRLDLDGTVRFSHEPDYRSYAAGIAGTLALDERATLLRLASTYSRDEVYQAQRFTDPATGDVTKDIVRVDQGDGFHSVVVAAGTTRTLAETLDLEAGYEFGYLSGYLGNPYRRVVIDGTATRERVPDRRLRHTLSVGLRWARPRVRGALHLGVRGYADDWAMRAITTEARWYQALGPYVVMRGRFRFYQQTATSFDSGQEVNAPTYPFGSTYTTANPRYAAMRSYEIGYAFTTRLGFLASPRHGFDRTEIEFAFDYRLSDNRFGDAITAAFAFRLPFR